VTPNEKDMNIKSLSIDHGSEIQMSHLIFFVKKMVDHIKKNKISEELAKTMLNESYLLKHLWIDVVSTTFYVINRVLIRFILKHTHT